MPATGADRPASNAERPATGVDRPAIAVDRPAIEVDRPAIEVDRLEVSYGSNRVLHGVNLSVAPGEFIAILGSSGCGKTTLLRTIAGFQKASAGAIRLFGRDVVNTPPEKRGMAMMFQSYAD